MIVYCVFLDNGPDEDCRLLDIFKTEEAAERFLKKWSNPLYPLTVEDWLVTE